jgi:hypothetical protein
MDFLIRTFLIQEIEKSIALPPIEVTIDDHQASFAFLNVFAVDTTLFSILFTGHGDDIILDLEGSP